MQDRASGGYGQENIMASQIMAETLEFQAMSIWDKERGLWQREGFDRFGRVIDVGCGTGQISSRLAREFGFEEVVGIDPVPNHIELARAQFKDLGNLRFAVGRGETLDVPDGHFDMAINRHVIQAIPHPEPLIHEMWRVIRPGGKLYFLAEDYGMLLASDTQTDRNWYDISSGLMSQGTDLLIGRKLPGIIRALSLPKPDIHYLNVSTANTPREYLAGIMRTWREGYTEFIVEHTGLNLAEVVNHFESLIRCCLDPSLDLVWHIPIVIVTKPE